MCENESLTLWRGHLVKKRVMFHIEEFEAGVAFVLRRRLDDYRAEAQIGNGLGIEDAIIALKCLAGIDISGELAADYFTSGQDVGEDAMIGFEEVLYILQVISAARL